MKINNKLLVCFIIFITALVFSTKVHAASASVSASATNVKPGTKVTITTKINGASWQVKLAGAVTATYSDSTSDAEEPAYVFSHELENSKEVIIPSRCFYPFKINEGDKPVAGITQKDDAIEIRAISSDRQLYIDTNGVKEPFVGTYKFICSKDENFKYTLSLGNRIVVISGEY